MLRKPSGYESRLVAEAVLVLTGFFSQTEFDLLGFWPGLAPRSLGAYGHVSHGTKREIVTCCFRWGGEAR